LHILGQINLYDERWKNNYREGVPEEVFINKIDNGKLKKP